MTTTPDRRPPQIIYTIRYQDKLFGTLLIVIMALFILVFGATLIIRALGHFFGL